MARKSNAPLGLKYASQALALYRKYSQATPLNTIYYILLKGECETLCGKSQEALNGCKEAERLALSLGDSATLSNVYHDMGCFATGAHDAKAVYYARLARDYSSLVIQALLIKTTMNVPRARIVLTTVTPALA